MKTQWTPAQKEAIMVRNKNILVSAAAGSGKTAVLIERLLQLILHENIGIDQILMVTFTNAAAGEMRSRIYQKLQETLETLEGEEQERIRRQLNLVGTASISTIHAFCMEVVRQYAFMLQLDSRFRIGDTTEMQLLKEETVQEILEQAYEFSTPDFLRLADLFSSSRSDQKLRECILQVYEFMQNQPDPESWLKDKVDHFNPDISEFSLEHPFIQKQRNQIVMLLEGAEDNLKKAISVAQLDPFLQEKYLPVFYRAQDKIQEFKMSHFENFQQFSEKCQKISIDTLPKVSKKVVDQDIKEKAKKLKEKANEKLNEAKQWAEKNWEQVCSELEYMKPVILALQHLMLDFSQKYQEKKNERGILDFNDLEHYALQLLRFEEVKRDYQNRFLEIFVDEYQDSNGVQEEILQSISRRNHRFMVGDVKQSIYRFRSADPDLFRHYYEIYTAEGDKPEISGKVINMQHNFRSTKMILTAINDIFSHIMKKQTAELDYDNQAKVLFTDSQMEGKPVELLLVETAPNENAEMKEKYDDWVLDELGKMKDIELEATMVAKKIQTLMQETIYENQTERPMQYHDIVILMRSIASRADSVARILEEHGVPVYASQGKSLFDAIEVIMFLDLLRLLDNQLQDIPLLSVLRSPIGKFSMDDLIQIRIAFPDGSYQKALKKYASTYQDDLSKRLIGFLQQCRIWQEDVRRLPLSEFIWKLFQDTGYYDYIGAMPGGKQRQANLRLLLEKAQSFQNQPQQGLFRFLKYIEKVQQHANENNVIAELLNENDDVVRIMSIHKSKGLEFPVVILMELGKKMNFQDTSARLLLHKDLGIGIQYADIQKHMVHNIFTRDIISKTIRMEELAEEMRILYVACTRAQQHLILSARVKKLSDIIKKKWNMGNEIYEIARANSFVDWIGMTLIHHPDSISLWNWIDEPYESEEDFNWASKWKIEIHQYFEFAVELQNKKNQEEEQKLLLQEDLLNFTSFSPVKDAELYQKLSWKYPFQTATQIPSKITVTQWKQMESMTFSGEEQGEINLQEPVFITQESAKERINALYRGTLTHQFLQHLDFSQAQTEEKLRDQLESIQQRGFFSEEERVSIRLDAVFQLVQSPLGKRIQQAQHLYREVPFNLMLPAGKIFPEYLTNTDALDNTTDEKIMVQGVIDLCFEEEDGWVLIDYKNDFIRDVDENKAKQVLKERYFLQVDVYRQALQIITKKRVKTAGLFLLSYGEFLELD